MTCDDYQIAFEQQRAGTSAAISAAELDAHVATCAVCTAYVSLSGKLSQAMTTTISSAPPLPTVEAIVARTSGWNRELRRSRIALPLLIAVVSLGYWLATHDLSPRMVFAGLVGSVAAFALGYIGFGLFLRRRISDLQALDSTSSAALLAGWRRELDRRIRNDRQAWWVLPVVLVGFHLVFVGPRAPSVGFLVFEILYLAIPLPLTVVRYRRLVREREELGR